MITKEEILREKRFYLGWALLAAIWVFIFFIVPEIEIINIPRNSPAVIIGLGLITAMYMIYCCEKKVEERVVRLVKKGEPLVITKDALALYNIIFGITKMDLSEGEKLRLKITKGREDDTHWIKKEWYGDRTKYKIEVE